MPRHNLPPQPTPFFGRSDELSSIQTLISDPSCRLLTVVGPGGIGKTRLALQAAANNLASFADGAYFVALAPLNSADSIVSTILEALKLPLPESLDPKLHLFRYLSSQAILLILDSFEHLMAGTTLIDELLAAAPEVKILVTSRERLNLAEEMIFELEGLSYPADNITTALESYSAVQLFLRGARRVDTKFTLKDADRSAIGRICQLVNGMPLGLELAATWTRTFSCQQIVEEIERDPDFLRSSLRNVPERHRSLRNVFDRSWTLLTPDEQSAFRRLSVFRGKFYRRAAEAVSGTSLLGLSALVDKSLLHVNGSGAYETHELVRQFAYEKLTASGELQPTRDRHLRYYVTLAEEAEPGLRSIDQEAWRVRIQNEYHNLRAALDWCKDEHGDVTTGLRLACALWVFWRIGGYTAGGVDYLDHLLGRNAIAPTAARAWALAIEAFLLTYMGRPDRAKGLAEATLLLVRASDEPGSQRAEALALNVLGSLARLSRDDQTARRYHRRATELSRALGDQWLEALALVNQGLNDFFQHDYDSAKARFEEALVLYRAMSTADAIVIYNCLTRNARRQERFAEALHWMEAALELSRQHRDTVNLVLTLSSLAGVCMAMGQAQQAVQLFGAAESVQTGISTRLPMSLREDTETTFKAARKGLDETAFSRMWAEGYAMNLEQAVAYAHQTLSWLMTHSHPTRSAASSEAQSAHIFPGDELTARELEVLQLLSLGMPNHDIARELVVTEGTVKRHTHSIYGKLGVRNRTQAILRARELKLA